MKKSEALSLLGLTETADETEIKKAHRRLIIENHPDKFGQDEQKRAQAEEKTKLINEARDVLLSGKWEPEYTSSRPYGAPYSHTPYTQKQQDTARPSATNPYEQDPFDIFSDWPFDQTTFVWTTWDPFSGKRTTYASSNPFAAGNGTQNRTEHTEQQSGTTRERPSSDARPFETPFTSTIFGTPFYQEAPSAEAKAARAKENLSRDIKFLILKFVLLAICAVPGAWGTGLYAYTIISIGQGIYKRLGALSIFVLIPFVVLAALAAPLSASPIGVIGFGCFAIALAFDVKNIVTHARAYRKFKKERATS